MSHRLFPIFTLLFLLVTTPLRAQSGYVPTQYDGDSWWNEDYNATEGTEFWVTYMDNYGKHVQDEDLSLILYATARTNAIVKVEGIWTDPVTHISTPFIKNFFINAGGVDSVFIPNEVAYLQESNQTENEEWLNKGIKITSNVPISLYSHNANVDSYDASLILPTCGLNKEYVIQTYSEDMQSTEFAIVSTQDNNLIKINLRTTKGNTSFPPQEILVSLEKGQSYCYRPADRTISLTGTTICATQPIAVFQGGQHAKIPKNTDPASHIYHQVFSSDYWGKTYVVTRTANQAIDIVRFTAAEDNTIIYKSGTPVKTLNKYETFEDAITWQANQKAVMYNASRATECYLYQSKRNSPFGSPALTPIVPEELGIKSVILATFHETRVSELGLPEDSQDTIAKYYKHFVNIVTETTNVSGVKIGNKSLASYFAPISGTNKSCAIIEIADTSHVLTSSLGTFTSRVYGIYMYDGEDYNYEQSISYAYSGGSLTHHPAWMLINGQQTNKYEICEGDPPVTFTSVINYDYTNIEWHHTLGGIKSGVVPATLINSNGVHATGDSVYNWQYIIPDHTQPNWKDTVYMIVTRQTPVCENFITDTIKAIVQVNDTFMIDENSYKGLDANVCFSRTDSFYVHLKGKTIGYIPDPSVPQYYNGKLIHLEYNKPYSFVDSLVTNSNCDTCLKCDSIIEQIRILRPVYDTIIYDTICVNHLPYNKIWGTTENGGGEPIYFDLSSAEKKELTRTKKGSVNPKIKNKDIRLKTIYGCDSTIHLQLVVLPVYEIKENITECKDTINPYEWKGHTNSKGKPLAGHKIYQRDEFGVLHRLYSYDMILRSTPGTYIFYDSLKTKGCKFCDDSPGCDSVHILTLSIKDQLKKIENKNLCDDSSFVWNDVLYLGPKYNKAIPAPYQAEGKHQRLLKNTHLEYIVPSQDPGICDSLYIVDVAWCPTHSTTQTFHICEDETYVFKPRAPKNDKKKEYKWTCEVENGVKKVGIYTLKDTVKTINVCDDGGEGCDSIVTHIVYVHPVYHDTTFITECQSFINKYSWSAINESEIWDKQKSTRISKTAIPLDKTGDFVYIDSLKTRTCNECRNGVGCDSILVLCLHINPIYDTIEQRSLCETDTIHWRGKVIVGGKAPEELAQGIKTRYWADPQPKPNDPQNKYRRPKTYRDIDHKWNGNKYTDVISLKTKDNCDSIYWLELTVYPSYEIHDTIHICDNKSDTWQGITYAGDKYKGAAKFKYAAGSEWHTKDTIFSIANGCDSVRYLHLMVHPTYDSVKIDSVCEGYFYEWDDHKNRNLYDSIQKKDVYFSGSIPANEPGWHIYVDRQKTVTCTACETGGCDSIWTLRLLVKPTSRETVTLPLCPEQLPYKFDSIHNRSANGEGTYYDTVPSKLNGCDSIITYVITVSEENVQPLTASICDNEPPYSYDYGPEPAEIKHSNRLENLHATGVYRDTVEIAGQCRKIYELHLTVNDTTTRDISYYLCDGETYTDVDFPDITTMRDTSYVKRLTKANSVGCDSVVYVTVRYGRNYEVNDPAVVLCERDSSYTWTTHDTYGSYSHTFKWSSLHEQILDTTLHDTLHTVSPYHCDSITSISIRVKPTVYYEHYETICPTQVPYHDFGNHNEDALVDGTYTHYITGGSLRYGCDSIEILHLTIRDSIVKHLYDTICNNELPYNHISPHPTPNLEGLMTSGTYRQILTAATGCDSTVVLHLIVNDTTTRDISYYLCDGETYTDVDFPDITTMRDTSYVKRLTKANSVGCDSVVYVTVSYGRSYEVNDPAVVLCERDSSYTWTTHDTYGSYSHTFKWSSLHEQILDTTLHDTLHTVSPYHCDSITSISIRVKPTVYYEHYETICPTQVPYSDFGNHNEEATENGTYTHYIEGGSIRYQCDSIEILHLTIRDSIVNHIYDTVCNNNLPYNHQSPHNTPNLSNLDATGVYRQILTAASGCDSTIVLHLQVNDTTTNEVTYYYCDGEIHRDLDFEDITSTKDTSYIKRLTKANSVGCDSVVYVTVRFGSTYTGDRIKHDPDVVLCERDSFYVWNTYDTHSATPYSHIFRWHSLNEQKIDTILYDTLHTASPYECDSVTSIHITVKPTTFNKDTVVWCASQGVYHYGENGKTTFESGDYVDTLNTKNQYGCDSILHLHLTILDSIFFKETQTLCENDTLQWQGIFFVGSKFADFGGIYDTATHPNVKTYPAGKYTDTVNYLTVNGCDSTYFLNLSILPTSYSEQERNVCEGEEDVIYEARHNGIGDKVPTNVVGDIIYYDTLRGQNQFNCDSVIKMTYHIRPNYHFSQGDIVLCQADSMWIWYNEDGDPQDTISLAVGNKIYNLGRNYKTIYGCDSTFGINVYVAPTYNFYDTLPLCENDSLHWQGMQFIGSQYEAYGKTYSPAGFDSTRVLSHGTYHFDVRRPTIHDCDSTYHLLLHVHEVAHTDSIDSVCQGHPFHNPNWNWGEGRYMNTERVGTYTSVDTIHSVVTGCDSIVTLTLRVDSVYDYRPFFEFCQDTIDTDTLVEWEDEAGKLHTFRLDISKADTLSYTDSLTSIHGCDSIFGVTWIVHPIYRFDTIIEICEDGRFVWQDTLYTGDSVRMRTPEDSVILAPGIYHRFKHFETVAGCDSDYYATIYVHPIFDTLTRITVCESDGFVWHQDERPHGQYHTYADTIVPVAYCDTIRLLPYEADLPQPKRDTTMRYYERMLQTVHGCDSLSRIWVTVQPTYCFLTDTTICANDRVKYRGKYFTSKDTIYVDRQYTEDGCDSTYILRLHVRPTFMNVRRVTMCDNEVLYHHSQNHDDAVWNPGDEIRDPEWEYYDMIYTDANGCDSIYRYYLTIYPAFHSIDSSVVMCSVDTILLHGDRYVGERIEFPVDTFVQPYTAYYGDTLRTIHDCDSVYGIYATIYPAYRHRDTITLCDDDTAVWREHTYGGLEAGEYTFLDSYSTIHGCDSIYELRLIVKPTYLFVENINKCADEDMTWHGYNLDHLPVGDYFFFDSLTTVTFGCDSVHHLYLTVNDTTSEIRHDTICRSEIYDFHGKPLTEPGYYYDTTLNEWGCHHYTHLYLTVIEPIIPTAWADSICANDSAYDLFYTYTGDYKPIAFSLKYDEEGHRNGFEDIIDQPITHPDELSWLRIPMPNIQEDSTKYPKPNYYRIKFILDNGICTDPDLCSTDTFVVLSYPSWITRQRFGDVIALYNDKYNGGYHWWHYQWYHGDELLVGETHEYLYVPTGLIVGDEYHVRLTREGETMSFQTCPITIVPDPVNNDFAPNMGYLATVQSTCVCSCNPVINILSRRKGVYRLTYNGVFLKQGDFDDGATPVEIPNPIDGMYIIQLWSPDTPEEPYRAIKIFVKPQCPNYENIPF